jgi:hypothetical protein
MQINKEIIAHFRDFIQTNNTIDNAQKLLRKYRNIQISNYNFNDSRCIWMSLMLYKFKKDMDVSEELWNSSRSLIISLLKSDLNLEFVIKKYLEEFVKWQKEDLIDLVTKIGGNYYNLIQIKNSIENTKNVETINHWLPHYENLISKIRSYCKAVGILEKVDEFVFAFEQKKYDIVKEIMDKAYWDKIEEDINENYLDVIYNNLAELKTILIDIIPKSVNTEYINEYFDIEYIKQLVNNKMLDKEYLLKLFVFVIGILKEWDADGFKEKYDNEVIQIKNLNTGYNNFIRCVIQKLMIMSFDLKNRKALWSIILKK